MTNEEKAHEIAIEVVKNTTSIAGLLGRSGLAISEIEESALKMAKWKDQQLIDKACDWLMEIENGTTITNINDFVEDFRKAMEE